MRIDDRIFDELNAWDTVYINKGVDLRRAASLKGITITDSPSNATVGVFNLMADDWQKAVANFSVVASMADFMITGPEVVPLPESMHITSVEEFEGPNYLIKGKRIP